MIHYSVNLKNKLTSKQPYKNVFKDPLGIGRGFQRIRGAHFRNSAEHTFGTTALLY